MPAQVKPLGYGEEYDQNQKEITQGVKLTPKTVGLTFGCLAVTFGLLFGVLFATGAFSKNEDIVISGLCEVRTPSFCEDTCLHYTILSAASNKQKGAAASKICDTYGAKVIFDRVRFSNDPTNTTLNNCVMPASELSAKLNPVNTTFLYAVANTCTKSTADACRTCLAVNQVLFPGTGSVLPASPPAVRERFPCTYTKSSTDDKEVCTAI